MSVHPRSLFVSGRKDRTQVCQEPRLVNSATPSSARSSLRGEHLPAPATVAAPVVTPSGGRGRIVYGRYGRALAALSRLPQPAGSVR